MLRCELVLVTRSWCYAVNLFLELGTQCVDHWWQSLEKALPQSLHVKDKPGGGIAEKLILGLRVAKQFSQPWPCQLNKRIGQNHVTSIAVGEKMKKLYTFERKGGWTTRIQKYRWKTTLCAPKPQRDTSFIFTKGTKRCKGSKFEVIETDDSTNNPRSNICVWPCCCLMILMWALLTYAFEKNRGLW